jgi:hypothetical protein
MVIPGRFPLDIERCYIPLDLRSGQDFEARRLLEMTGGVLLLGDPGSGKSALLSWLVRALCVGAIEDKTHAKLPVYISMYNLAERLNGYATTGHRRPQDAFALIEEWFFDNEYEPLALISNPFNGDDHVLGTDPTRLLGTLARERANGVVICLDGLDEVGVENLHDCHVFIGDLLRYMDSAQGDNLLIVASRRQAVEASPIENGELRRTLHQVELRPFSPAAVYAFMIRWNYGPTKSPPEEAGRLFSNLSRNPTLMDTCSNPLALALYIHQDQRLREASGDLLYPTPSLETRAGFFTDVVDHLLVRRRVERTESRVPNLAFRQQRADFFVRLAEEHVTGSDQFNRMPHDMVVAQAGRLRRTGRSPDEALWEIATDSGLIRPNDDGTWSFIHRAFVDYFYGCAIATSVSKKRIEQLIRRIRTDENRHAEGFFFACGLMAAHHSQYLTTALGLVGNSAFVGRLYPRAAYESQAYFDPGFVERMKFFVREWHRDRSDTRLLRDIVRALMDYEQACLDLGREREVSIDGQFREGDLETDRWSQLDVETAWRLVGGRSVVDLLAERDTDEVIVSLYNPSVLDAVLEEGFLESDRLCAIASEAALRSSLVSTALLERQAELPRRSRFSLHTRSGWSDAWPVRLSLLSDVFARGIPFVRGLGPAERARFPHVSLLGMVRPIRRLRYELWFGSARATLVAVSVLVLTAALVVAVGGAPYVAAGVVVLMILGLTLLGRYLAERGSITLASVKVLNLNPIAMDVGYALGHRVRMVSGLSDHLSQYHLRAPKGRFGTHSAVYERYLGFVWRRFCPSLGDTRMTRATCANVQQMWTEDVRNLLRSG